MKTKRLLLVMVMASFSMTSIWAEIPLFDCDSIVYTEDGVYFYKSIYEKRNQLEVTVSNYEWDSGKNAWSYKGKAEYSFDVNGNEILFCWYNPEDAETQKIETEYDAKGNPTLMINYSRENNNWKVFGKYKYEYVFDARDNITQENQFKWVEASNNWINYAKTDNKYDTQGNLTEDKRYNWNSNYSVWVPAYTNEYEYNSQGKAIKRTYKRVSSCTVGSSGVSNVQYDADVKYDYLYDALGNRNYEEKHGEVRMLSRYIGTTPVYAVAPNALISYINYEHDAKNRIKTEKEYTVKYKVVNDHIVLADNPVSVQIATYYYSVETNLPSVNETAKMMVYPNPTNDFVYVKTENGTLSELKLYSFDGRLLKHSKAAEIDLSGYSTGIYFLSVDGKMVRIIRN